MASVIARKQLEVGELQFRVYALPGPYYLFYILFTGDDQLGWGCITGSAASYKVACDQFIRKNAMLTELCAWAEIRGALTKALDDYEWLNLCQSLNRRY